VGGVAEIAMPGAAADQVIAQSPPANASGVSAPKISLLVTTSAEPQGFVMPSFVGQLLGSVARTLQDSGMKLGAVTMAPPTASIGQGGAPGSEPGVQQGATVSPQVAPSSTIVSQIPPAGQKVFAGSTVSLVVKP